MPIDETLRSGAVQLLVAGYQPVEVVDGLVRLGVPAHEAHVCVSELVALKAAADARDPARLRARATWLLFHGAPREEVVQYFETMGIAREHGAPEVERLAIEVRSLVPCERCRTPIAAASAVFDKLGATICGRCDQPDQTREYDRRAVESMEQERAQNVALFGAIGGGLGLGVLMGRSATTPPEHAAKGRVASARRQSARFKPNVGPAELRETPIRFREGFRARSRLDKPRSFRLRSAVASRMAGRWRCSWKIEN